MGYGSFRRFILMNMFMAGAAYAAGAARVVASEQLPPRISGGRVNAGGLHGG